MVEARPQNLTLTGALPRDRPTEARAHRLYVATTNHCNRACPWCSTCSSPAGSTFLSTQAYSAAFPTTGMFEVQLEGGEPTIHPEFWTLVELARAEPRCERLILVTNGVVLPRTRDELREYVERLGVPLTIKLSINHHLLAQDPGLLALAELLREVVGGLGGQAELVLNVRLREDAAGQDAHVLAAVENAGLLELANVFFLQRYGFAADREGWETPFLVGTNFTLLNPDGSRHGSDLIGRSEAMRVLP